MPKYKERKESYTLILWSRIGKVICVSKVNLNFAFYILIITRITTWLKTIIWVIESWEGLFLATDILTTCAEAIFRVTLLLHRPPVTHMIIFNQGMLLLGLGLSKRQSPTTVLLRTPVTQMIMFNQGTVCYCWAQTIFLFTNYNSLNLNERTIVFPQTRFCKLRVL